MKSFKCLGTSLDESLSFCDHVNYILNNLTIVKSTTARPWIANILLNHSSVARVVALCTGNTPIHLECASMGTRNIVPCIGTVYTRWSRDHGFTGQSQGCSLASAGAARWSWHTEPSLCFQCLVDTWPPDQISG